MRNRLGQSARSLASEPSRLALDGNGLAVSVAVRDQDVLLVLAPDEAVMNTLAQSLAGG